MVDQAKAARENSICLEAKKDGLQQRQGGDWMLRFTVAAIDMDQRITQAPMGTRYQVVLVEIDDNESPTDHTAMARDKWRDLGPAKQAGMRCKEPTFWAFMYEQHAFPVSDEIGAADAVRVYCNVASRADLAKPGYADERATWHDLDFAYQAWKAAENA